ncbi:hypothetical protein HK405_015153 [Cladochytrium tenue]|nr:hypothetical protein HK405_015153 [Cladochytrium tenue]
MPTTNSSPGGAHSLDADSPPLLRRSRPTPPALSVNLPPPRTSLAASSSPESPTAAASAARAVPATAARRSLAAVVVAGCRPADPSVLVPLARPSHSRRQRYPDGAKVQKTQPAVVAAAALVESDPDVNTDSAFSSTTDDDDDDASSCADSDATTLLDLPNELLVSIAMRAGFASAITLAVANRRLYNLLMDPASWHDYARPGSSVSAERIESVVTICSKVHSFDHLVFGLWPAAPETEDGGDGSTAATETEDNADPARRLSSTPSAVAAAAGTDPRVYFEHLAFNEQYDFLGGVALHMSAVGHVSADFFPHRESLPCYQRALRAAVAAGTLPPSAPDGEPPAGARIPHACPDCADYDRRRPLKSIFVLDELAHHRDATATAVAAATSPRPSTPAAASSTPVSATGRHAALDWTYDYPCGRRRIRVRVRPFHGALGYCSIKDLPSVFVNRLCVGGRPLSPDQYHLFLRLVNPAGRSPA